MKINIITLFPRFFDPFFSQSIPARAVEAGILDVSIHDLKEHAAGSHHLVDDYRFGGGPGMLLKPEAFFSAFNEISAATERRPLVVFPTPQGQVFSQPDAADLAREPHLVFICGHYKGIDQRVVDRFVDREYSVGDYVLSGGEIASAVIIDAIVRLLPGAIGNLDSALTDSFQTNVLDAPHYTRPEDCGGLGVPEVLLTGNHRNIAIWRQAMSVLVTRRRRPDLIKKANSERDTENGKLEGSNRGSGQQ